MEEVDLNEKVQRVLEDLELQIQDKQATVTTGALPVILGHKRQMQQLFQNLIGNALKYSPGTERVEVRLRHDAGRVYVDVRDNGLGMPADSLERVFEKFHRSEDLMTMSTSGTGLGLFIARQLARAMGGDVTVVSTLNAGSVFTLSLVTAGRDRQCEPESA